MVEPSRCAHCGAENKRAVTKTIDGRALAFCCAGCLQVYELLREEGAHPAKSGRGAPARIQAQQASAMDPLPARTPSTTIRLSIVGMTCANCVAHVERGLRSVPGVLDVRVDLAAERATVDMIPGAVTLAGLRQAVEDAGYEVVDAGEWGGTD
jgi:copper chaperone CopZ